MVYDQYPGSDSQYPKGTPSQFPFSKQDFHQYQPGQLIAKSANKEPLEDLIVTSGTLTCQENRGVKDGFTTTHNFRMLINPMDGNQVRVRYTDYRFTTLATIERWHDGRPNWAGMHLFARYQTSDNLYVGSYRTDGLVTLKKKIATKYTTLGQVDIGAPETGKEYVLAIEVDGSSLRFFIDGKQVLAAFDSDLTWGTSGIRLDYSDSYVDFIKVNDV